MRSDRPKPLHMICGRAMVMHVIESLRLLEPTTHRARRRPRRRPRDGRGVEDGAGVGERHVRRAAEPTRHRRRRGVRHDRVAGRRPRRRLDRRRAARRHAAAARRDARGVGGHARRQRTTRRPCSPAWSTTPTGYGRVIRGKDGNVLGIVEQRDATAEELAVQRDQHEHLRVPPRPARPGAAPPLARQRPGRVLPHRRDRLAGRDGPPGGMCRGAGGGDPGGQRSLAARPRRAGAAVAHEPLLAAQRRDDARSPPDVHRRHRAARPGRHAVPGHDAPRLDAWSTTGATSGPNTRLTDCKVGQGVQIQYSVADGVEFGAGARVGPYAALTQGTTVESNEVTGPFYTGGSEHRGGA